MCCVLFFNRGRGVNRWEHTASRAQNVHFNELIYWPLGVPCGTPCHFLALATQLCRSAPETRAEGANVVRNMQ